MAVLVRGNRLPEVGCKSMSGVDKDEEPAYRLYFYSVCILYSFAFLCVCPNELGRTVPLSCLLVCRPCRRETLHLPLTQQSLENKLSLWCMGGKDRLSREYRKSYAPHNVAYVIPLQCSLQETACLQLIKWIKGMLL